MKDLVHFLDIDPRLKRTVVLDSNLVSMALDLDNLVPVIPYLGENTDTQLAKLARFLKSLTKVEDVKVSIRNAFKFSKELKKHFIERIINSIFESEVQAQQPKFHI